MKKILEEDYDVLEASRYSEAVSHLKSRIDLTLIDYRLPDMDGFEVVREIRKEKPALPIIMMTGFSTENALIKAVRSGVTDYIKKPLNLKYLMDRLSDIFGGKKVVATRNREGADSECVENREEFIVDGVVMYIEENFMKDFSLDKLSGMAHMSKSKFCKAFKERKGQGFKSYVNNVRIRNASELLSTSSLTISEIAYFVGFDNLVSFYRVFREIYGVSPKEFREIKGV